MKTILVSAAVLLLSATVHAEVSVQPIGLTVGSPAIEAMDFSLRPNGINSGTGIHLLVTGFDNPIVKLDDDNSTLNSATDSTGKDLLQEQPQQDNGFSFSSSGPIGPFPKISEDGTQLVVDLNVPQAPAPGATSITLDGTLHVTVAAGMANVKAEGVATQPGTIDLGGHAVEVLGVSPSDWEEGKFKLELKMQTDLLDEISTWKITAADGTELSDGPNSTMTMNTTAQLEMTLEKKPDTFNIELELYDGLETIEVPVAVEAGLGIE